MITINLDKAKIIAHDIRRSERAAEFTPLDDIIRLQIPGTDAVAIEAERQAVRDKYAAVQQAIDAAGCVDEIKVALKQN